MPTPEKGLLYAPRLRCRNARPERLDATEKDIKRYFKGHGRGTSNGYINKDDLFEGRSLNDKRNTTLRNGDWGQTRED